MVVEILFTGLCVVSVSGGLANPTAAAVGCPGHASHAMYLTVPAAPIKTWPEDVRAGWLTAPDGTDYAIFTVDSTLKGTFIRPEREGFTASGLGQLLRRSDLQGEFAAGARQKFWKFPMEISSGHLAAVNRINQCFEVPAGGKDRLTPFENVRWTRRAEGITFSWETKGKTVYLSIEGGEPVRLAIGNDVGTTVHAKGHGEFKHWLEVENLWLKTTDLKHPCPCGEVCEEDAAFTSKPICNLLLDQ